ncbi:hypothetical protein [uncultured Brachyspira sp.]|uniref:hypothetical protein n=1 Tax=uncultured Brachyspira sp. TaxID=221953 RepID=UPI0026385039|nr:hypothetical protein [uncultured Brachyspira sp.]
MLKRLLITFLLLISLFAISCKSLKDTIEENIIGIDKTYAGIWNVDETPNVSDINFSGSYIIIKEDGAMDFYFGKADKTFSFSSGLILKVKNGYIAVYNEIYDDNGTIASKEHLLEMTFEEINNNDTTFSSAVNVIYTVKENNVDTIIKGVFIKQAE